MAEIEDILLQVNQNSWVPGKVTFRGKRIIERYEKYY